jgi:cysteinyl-tRNA synthetase
VGTRLANFWMHGYFLLQGDAKMAKSAGEFLRLKSLTDRGYDPLAYRYLCLTAHYRSQLNFTWDALDSASIALERMRKGFYALPGGGTGDGGYLERFTGEINDDLNLPRALALAWELLRGDVVDLPVARTTLAAFDRVFGLGLVEWRPREEAVPAVVQALAAARSAARAARQWAEADRLRGELHAAGWEMEDSSHGYALKRRSPE